jgi:hypothetical protein
MQRGVSCAYDEAYKLIGTCNFLCLTPAVASLCAEEGGSILTGKAMSLFANRASVERAKSWRSGRCKALPTILDLHPEIEVRIDLEETSIKPFVGPPEYQWPQNCPDVCSAMTAFQRPLNGSKLVEL